MRCLSTRIRPFYMISQIDHTHSEMREILFFGNHDINSKGEINKNDCKINGFLKWSYIVFHNWKKNNEWQTFQQSFWPFPLHLVPFRRNGQGVEGRRGNTFFLFSVKNMQGQIQNISRNEWKYCMVPSTYNLLPTNISIWLLFEVLYQACIGEFFLTISIQYQADK